MGFCMYILSMSIQEENNWYFSLLLMNISGFKRSIKIRSCSMERVQENGRTGEWIDSEVKTNSRRSVNGPDSFDKPF